MFYYEKKGNKKFLRCKRCHISPEVVGHEDIEEEKLFRLHLRCPACGAEDVIEKRYKGPTISVFIPADWQICHHCGHSFIVGQQTKIFPDERQLARILKEGSSETIRIGFECPACKRVFFVPIPQVQ
ncbi:MAG: hypothetical protein D6778_01290 [Nitrospirae bacterium]|nr:MAG: hypothetical protein D6778_01290 [Nitrospirota bacterium]